ncbi:hypothetical protein [Bacillus sp. AFS017336]|uniref:hypothetical protein n=1 Tax=Bacillus sp. AFS017336 TaxID=2033489 RepID=UPI000BF1C37D|nr:hypothetical protein [Bacillus sp. AFS017336]PEL13790.1 hypothetical protein CN601_03500 [Bacillus sp. AFS017336]
MEKTISIDGKQVRFKSTGATPLRYKAQFSKDYFVEIIKLNSISKLNDLNKDNLNIEDLEGLDFEVFYNIAWTMAKTADKDIPDPMTWLDTFDSFPMIEIIPELQELIMSSMQSKKK